MPDYLPLLEQALKENDYPLAPDQVEKLNTYLTLLAAWNHAFNLTAITEPHEMVYLHIIDSLSANPFLHGTRFLDVGTGAGLPGIPLAITHPEQHWVLLDKNGKKNRFLTQAIAELGLSHVKTAQTRAEDFKPTAGFDSILSRAYGSLCLFLETTEHLLNPGGTFIAMKGKYPEEELEAVPSRFSVESVTRLDIRGMSLDRHVVCIKKISK